VRSVDAEDADIALDEPGVVERRVQQRRRRRRLLLSAVAALLFLRRSFLLGGRRGALRRPLESVEPLPGRTALDGS